MLMIHHFFKITFDFIKFFEEVSLKGHLNHMDFIKINVLSCAPTISFPFHKQYLLHPLSLG